ncbi:MAG TPA: ATP-binding protein [Gemmatimonadales bacterium]|nr:ATP-binding protein [Gemmatimonadales bacterium]
MISEDGSLPAGQLLPRGHEEKMGAVARVARGLSDGVGDLVDQAAAAIHEVLAAQPGQRSQLEDAAASLQRASLIARQLEVLGKPAPNRRRPVSVGLAVEELMPLAIRLAGPSVVVRASRLGEGAWASLAPGQLEQTVFHLVVNARDAMPEGGSLEVAVERISLEDPLFHRYGVVPGGDWVRVEVRDSGSGMPDEVLARLFEPFFTTKPVGLGSGLGLATVYAIAHQLGGQVTVESVIGTGTTIGVWFPACDPEPAHRYDFPDGAAILVVDDDEWVRNSTAATLRRAGYGVLDAADAEAALCLLGDVAGCCVRVVLTDVRMPGISGGRLAAALADRWPSLKVVLMTGAGGAPPAGTEALPLLRKPFTREELLAVIAV